jgi:hypothetical protein
MDAVSATTLSPMKRYHVGRATATSLANNYIQYVKLRRNYPSITVWQVRGRFALTTNR